MHAADVLRSSCSATNLQWATPESFRNRGRPGAVFRALLVCGLALGVHESEAAFTLIDDFEGYAGGTAIHGQGFWRAETTTDSGAAGVAFDPLDSSNRVLVIGDGGFQGGRLGDRETANFNPALRIPQGSVATVFFRLAWARQQMDVSVGMTDVEDPLGDTVFNPFSQFESQLALVFLPGDDRLRIRDGGSLVNLTDQVMPLQWYNVWMVVDNAADTTDIFILGGEFTSITPLRVAGFPYGFRNGTANNDLTTFFIATGRNTSNVPPAPTEHIGPLYLDDLYVDLGGRNLVNPIPEPRSACLALLGVLVVSRRRRAAEAKHAR